MCNSAPNCDVWVSPLTTKQLSNTSWCRAIHLSSDTIYPQIAPAVKDWRLSPPRLPPTPLLRPIPSLRCHLYFWLTSCRSEGSTTSSLGSTNLLEQFTELTVIFYMPDDPFVIKGYAFISETARWERCTGPAMVRRLRAFMLSEHPLSPSLHVYTDLKALWTPFFRVFIEDSLHGHELIKSSSPSLLLIGQWVGLNVPTF